MKEKRTKIKDELTTQFKNAFKYDNKLKPRGIGIECEIPIVTSDGNIAPFIVIKRMFNYLHKEGFELVRDKQSREIESARRINADSIEKFDSFFDTITTDVGYSIIELILAPQKNLFILQDHLSKLLNILKKFFKTQDCFMLGYGIQPLGEPSEKIMMPKERCFFYNKFSSNEFISQKSGSDACLLTITASNQCHIEIELEKSIPAVNTLNALSALQIALCANSPIWLGKVEKGIKANRENLWKHCFPNRKEQIGIPPRFNQESDYIQYLLDFNPFLIEREGRFYKILNKSTYQEYFENEEPCFAEAFNGEVIKVTPKIEDINQLFSYSWFNTLLVPKHGTIESRMCCQQPPHETLCSTALTLGLIENLKKTQAFESQYSFEFWKELRLNAIKDSLNVFIDNISIISLIKELLDIAKEGLIKRGKGEEHFLEPLYTRLEEKKSPADAAIEFFKDKGIKNLVKELSF